MMRGKKIKCLLTDQLWLWATSVQSYWGPSERLCGTCLRVVPPGGKEAVVYSLSVFFKNKFY